MAETYYHEAPAQEASALPVMLPGKLVGRDPLLATIYGHLKQNEPILLHGAPGIGKTAIAATLASAYTQQPGGALWLNVDDDDLASLVVRVGRAYGDFDIANSENPLGMVGAASSLLSQRKPLIVLDGQPSPSVVTEFVNKVAPNLPLIITHTDEIEGTWNSVAVPPLAEEDARALFVDKSSLNSPEVDDIIRLLGQHPFSLVLAAGTARVAKLDAPTLMSALQSAGAQDPSGRALQVGFGQLKQALQGILLMLGATFNGGASLDLLAQLSGAPKDTVQKVMTILSAAGFVQRDQRYNAPYYYLHPLTYDYARSFLQGADRLETLQNKARDTIVAYAEEHASDNTADQDALAVEMSNFLAAAAWANERGEPDVASQIVVALTQADSFVKARGYLYELLQLQASGSSGAGAFPANADVPPEVMDLIGATPEDTEPDEEALPDDLFGNVLEPMDTPEETLPEEPAPPPLDPNDPESLRSAINDARADNDLARVRDLQMQLGDLLRRQEKHTEALAVYNDLLATYEESDDKQNALSILQKMASIMILQESSQAAVLHATRGVNLAQELDEQAAHARLLILLGDARQQLGESADAITAYSQAIDIAEKEDDHAAKADAMMKLGFAQLDDDETDTAIQTWNEALELCRALEKRDCEGRILGGLGTAYGELERWSEAINYHKSALYIAREVNDAEEIALQLSNLGFAAKQAGLKGEAVLRYRQALHMGYEIDDRDNIVTAIVDLVRLLVESPAHLKIAKLLIDDAAGRDGGDRDVVMLKERANNELMMAEAQNQTFKAVDGTAKDYARNAYVLLDG